MKQDRPLNPGLAKRFLNCTFGLLAASALMTHHTATGHGYMETPKARQAICKAQEGYWWPEDGSAIPNQACRQAFLQNGHVVFTQAIEFSANVADFNNIEAVKATIPDGSLCAAGSEAKSGADIPSPYWQRTQVTPDAAGNISVEFWASTPHNPSFWEFYLTRPDFDGSQDVLSWGDLTLIQTHGDLAMITKSNGRRYYIMDVAIPPGRSGDAVLYTRWQRDDAAGEGFYNCSDIAINIDSQPPQWSSIGYFWTQADAASEGDSVRIRLFSASGSELIDLSLLVDASNSSTWQSDLAATLNQDYATLIKVGIDDGTGNIAFDGTSLVSNQVFTVNSQYSFDLTVTRGDTSQYPQWQEGTVYVAGDKVQYQGNNYQAKWWTRGEIPGNTQVWEAL